MKVYKVFNIQFDTDGDKELEKELQEKYDEMYFSVKDKKSFVPAEELADKISDVTGFCIFGCNYRQITIHK